MNEKFWGEMLGVLKDVGSYLEKQDATQERAKIDTPPKMSENPKPIKGGDMPAGFKPADKLAKEYVPIDEAKDRDASELSSKDGQTLLKEDEFEDEMASEEDEELEDEELEDEEEDEYAEEDVEEDEFAEEGEEESMDELKSLLKDIRNALVKSSKSNNAVTKEIKAALPSIVKGETDKMLRKMGFTTTHNAVKKLDVNKSYGLDTPDETKEIKKSNDKAAEMEGVLDNMSKKSWTELGQLRENTEGFQPFGR